MGGNTVSTKRNRVYKHKFDHDLARVMREEGGLSFQEIAEEMGVSITAIRLAIYPDERARNREGSLRRQKSGTCIDCGEQISKNTSKDIKRCRDCWAINRSITTTKSAREDTLLCCRCKEWLPDDAFRGGHIIGRRLRKETCMACETINRREYRQRIKLLDPEKHAAQVERHRLKRIARKNTTRAMAGLE